MTTQRPTTDDAQRVRARWPCPQSIRPARLPRRFASLPLVVLLGFLASCGGPADPARSSKIGLKDLETRYPASRFIRGVGQSDVGRREAELDARRVVAEQISSEIRSHLQVTNESVGGVETARVRASVEASADFAYGELIEIIDRATICVGARCEALAVLERGRATDALEALYAAERPSFVAAADAALSATELAEFTRSFRVAGESFDRLAPLARQIAVIARAPFPPHIEDRVRSEALLAERARRLGDVRITLILTSVEPAPLRETLSAAFSAAFGALGLQARPGATCESGLAFEPTASMKCGLGMLGPSCELAMTGRLKRCPAAGAEGGLSDLDFADLKLRGVHPSTEAEARARLLGKIGSAPLADRLREGLKPVVPIR